MATTVITALAVAGFAAPAWARQDARGCTPTPRPCAEVRLGVADGPADRGLTFNALAGMRLEAEIWGRMPRGVRRVFARYTSPKRRCSSSYARDTGTRLGRGRFVVSGRRFSVGTRHRWGRARSIRLCVWLTRSARSRTVARTQVVTLHDGLGGLALAPTGSLAGRHGLAWGAVSTDGFFGRRETLHRPAPRAACPPARRDAFSADSGLERIHKLGGFITDTSSSPCPADLAWNLQLAAGPRGSHALAYAAAELAQGTSAPIKHIGDCVLTAAMFRTVAEAEVYVRAVGCVPGDVIERRRTPLSGFPQPGEVYLFEIHGGQADIAPPRTVVDLIAQPTSTGPATARTDRLARFQS